MQELVASLNLEPFVQMFCGQMEGQTDCSEMVARCWNLATINCEYSQFLEKCGESLNDFQARLEAPTDHYGLTGYFQDLPGAPVYALDEGIRIFPIEWEPRGAPMVLLGEFSGTHGRLGEPVARSIDRSPEILRIIEPQPQLTPLHEGDDATIGGCPYKIYWIPGHADGNLLLHGPVNGLLFSGDIILKKVTPNIPMWTGLVEQVAYSKHFDELNIPCLSTSFRKQ